MIEKKIKIEKVVPENFKLVCEKNLLSEILSVVRKIEIKHDTPRVGIEPTAFSS